MICWFCKSKMIWQSDFNYEDFGRRGEGVVAILCCSSCDASAEFSLPNSEKDKHFKILKNGRDTKAKH